MTERPAYIGHNGRRAGEKRRPGRRGHCRYQHIARLHSSKIFGAVYDAGRRRFSARAGGHTFERMCNSGGAIEILFGERRGESLGEVAFTVPKSAQEPQVQGAVALHNREAGLSVDLGYFEYLGCKIWLNRRWLDRGRGRPAPRPLLPRRIVDQRQAAAKLRDRRMERMRLRRRSES